MQHDISTARPARIGIKFLAPMALLAVITALSPATAQTCRTAPRDCSAAWGADLDKCLVWNGRIQHACNADAQYEQQTGRGPRYRKDIQNSQDAGSLDSATSDDEPAPQK